MLSIRNLRHRITAVSPTVLLSLLVNNEYNCTQIFRCHIRASSSHIPACEFIKSSLTNLYLPILVFGMWDGFNRQMHSLSTLGGAILVQARDPAKLSMEIENAIDDHRFNDAWKLFEQHMHMEGFPRKSIVNKLLASFAESFDVWWLEKAYGLVEQATGESKQNLLEKEPLIYLSFGLAKCGLSVPASTIMRMLIEMELYPPVTAWSAIVGYMSQTAPGAYLAAELILEIGYLFQDGRVDLRKKSNAPLIAMKPNATSVNMVLAGCLLFGKTRKAEQLLDMMPRISIKVNATLLITMAHIYERNGRREELKKLKRHVDEAYGLSDIQFRQFYTCLLICHLKLGDLESASNMVLKMLQKAKEARNSLAAATLLVQDKCKSSTGLLSQASLDPQESDDLNKSRSIGCCMISYEEFSKDRNFLTLEAEAKELLGALLGQLQTEAELITSDHGVLLPTEKIYVKLVKTYLESGKTKELVAFLNKVEKEDSPASNDDSILVHVINSCISLGWLDQAHDLLDEMRLAGIRASSSVYASLLKSYCKASRAEEAASLLRDACRAGIQLDASCYDALIESRVLKNDTHGALHLFKEAKDAKIHRSSHQKFEMLVKGCSEGGEAGLMTKLLQEIEDGQTFDSGVHVWNNIIHFFCRKKLMQDAEKALKKMRSLGHVPNAQTFHSMVTGYAAVGGKYVEVTELWGEMKALAATTSMKFDQELLDSVLYTFVRGGFFVRANEVVDMMEKGNMFIDKYKYRSLFLKYHKTLHKGKVPKFQTEAQLKKREAALSFKNWISKKQHQLVASMKQSGKSIQSKSLNRVLGNIDTLHVQPYEEFVKEEQKKLHEHWLKLANKDLPKAYENWRLGQSQRYEITKSLEQGIKGKLESLMEEEERVNHEGFHQDQNAQGAKGHELGLEDEEEFSQKTDFEDQNDQEESNHEYDMEDEEELNDEAVLDYQNDQGAREHEAIVENEEKESPDRVPPQDLNGIRNQESKVEDNELPGSDSPQYQSPQQISSLGRARDINPVDVVSESNNATSRSNDASPNASEYLGNANIADASISQGFHISSSRDAWQSVSMPHTFYDSNANHDYTSASGLSLPHQVNGAQRPQIIDLESDMHENDSSKGLLHRQSVDGSFGSYPNHDPSGLLQSLFKGQEMLPYHRELKQVGLCFQSPNNMLIEDGHFTGHIQRQLRPSLPSEQGLKRQGDSCMPQSMSEEIYSEGSGFLIPRQGHVPSVNLQDWHVNPVRTPARLQSHLNTNDLLLTQNWYSGEHQVRGGWNATDSASVTGQVIGNNTDQSLFSVLSQCNQLRSRSHFDSMGPTEQFMLPRNYDMTNGIAPRISNSLPQTAHPLDFLSGREAPNSLMPDEMGWMTLPQSSGLNDSVGKPYLRSWNQ